MRRIILFSLSLALFASGCAVSEPHMTGISMTAPSSNLPKTDLKMMQGSWQGRETTPGREGTATLKILNDNLEFHGANENDWVKGTFSLVEDSNPRKFAGLITACASPEVIGKKVFAIYKLDAGTLTLTGNPPDEKEFPATFDAPNTRQFVFKQNP